MSKTHQQYIGSWGETVAGFFLESRGYQVLARNVRTPHGEIDLVTRQKKDGELVFVEVKTRTNGSLGLPEEAVDLKKLEHLLLAAEAYLQAHPDQSALAWRIDIVAIQGKPGSKVEDVDIQHFENVSA